MLERPHRSCTIGLIPRRVLLAVVVFCVTPDQIAKANHVWGADFPQEETPPDRCETPIQLKGQEGATFTACIAEENPSVATVWIVRDLNKAVVFSEGFWFDSCSPSLVVADADGDGIKDLVVRSDSGGSWASRTMIRAVLMGPGTIASYQVDWGRTGRVAAKFGGVAKQGTRKALRAFLKWCATACTDGRGGLETCKYR